MNLRQQQVCPCMVTLGITLQFPCNKGLFSFHFISQVLWSVQIPATRLRLLHSHEVVVAIHFQVLLMDMCQQYGRSIVDDV